MPRPWGIGRLWVRCCPCVPCCKKERRSWASERRSLAQLLSAQSCDSRTYILRRMCPRSPPCPGPLPPFPLRPPSAAQHRYPGTAPQCYIRLESAPQQVYLDRQVAAVAPSFAVRSHNSRALRLSQPAGIPINQSSLEPNQPARRRQSGNSPTWKRGRSATPDWKKAPALLDACCASPASRQPVGTARRPFRLQLRLAARAE
ncbi:hypothetical protein DFH27DRAFT_155881 [Peziza echinospora]|nr:hypothetical protein DFH27DRAFT_155881 [Peziza echinospora]